MEKLHTGFEVCAIFLQENKLILIVNDKLHINIGSIIYDFSEIHSVYIFCLTKDIITELKHQKIKGTFNNKHYLIADLLADFSYPMSIFNQEKERSIQALAKESLKFIWFQCLIDLIIHLPWCKKSKSDMVNECRQHYETDEIEMRKISEFDTQYGVDDEKNRNAIRWYTRDCFLFRLLNRAFRTENIDEIYKFRYFIPGLHSQLKELHRNYISSLFNDEKYLTVYRGQFLFKGELLKLKKNIGQLISFNTFLSSTLNRQVALLYTGGDAKQPRKESVLFEMKIHQRKCHKPFSDISNHGYYEDEKEVLISTGAVFRIISVERLKENADGTIWNVSLLMDEGSEEQMKELMNHFTNESITDPLEKLKIFIQQLSNNEITEQWQNILYESATRTTEMHTYSDESSAMRGPLFRSRRSMSRSFDASLIDRSAISIALGSQQSKAFDASLIDRSAASIDSRSQQSKAFDASLIDASVSIVYDPQQSSSAQQLLHEQSPEDNAH
ncbi:unnamed protein product [Didymodactylos carnosus]|uniref:NAD(P)(+)--arginine ADP-ribosyltransferase n=1 Tax=Didymodactylos carnosus TaxID=1234261 RepID=A0A814NYL2_9BILA|nr:unnamed protein product [Didymodactylos carnosus]CAF1100297.1 unnamed protein product [Didymodactylos carnosus]CAF3811447.1 unnamed protein product [Didymodactylos carnosus]CAF3865286.1 unnamed protein product [Didymodactylos carnosus]